MELNSYSSIKIFKHLLQSNQKENNFLSSKAKTTKKLLTAKMTKATTSNKLITS